MPMGFKGNNGISKMPERLSAFSDDLEAMCRSCEPDFLRMGGMLQSIYAEAAGLAAHTLESVRHMGVDSEAGILNRVEGLVRDSLAELERRHGAFSSSLNRIETVSDCLGNFHRLTADAERIGMFLGMIGLNMAIESSRSQESREMFTVVTREVRRVSEKIIQVSGNIRTDSENARSSQLAARTEIFRDLKALEKLSHDALQTVNIAVRQIEELMGLSRQALEGASAHFKAVSDQVGKVVVGIQFHDNMAQRISHVASALDDARSLCREALSASRRRQAKKEKLKAARFIVEIQSAQVKEAIGEIDSVYGKSRAAFREIGMEIGSIVTSLSSLGRENEDPFSRLKPALLELHHLLGKAVALDERICTAAGRASEAATRLLDYTEQVRRVGHETHIKALNAIVNAAHLGDSGKTLEVLAQEIKSSSDRTGDFVGEIARRLQSISGADESPASRTAHGSASLLEAGIEEITAAYAHFKDGSSDAVRRAESLREAISRTEKELEFFPMLAERLGRHLRGLEDMGRALGSRQGGKTAVNDQLAQRYTMKQERDVHERLIGSTESVSEGQVTGTARKPDPLGENVELF